MTNEDDYTKTVGFGYDLSTVEHSKHDLLNSTIWGYLSGYLRSKGESYRPRMESYNWNHRVFYSDEHPMGVKDLFSLRMALPEDLRSSVRLYKIATRMVPEVIAMAIGDIEMTGMKEQS